MPMLTDTTIWALRCEAAESGNCDLSRLCSAALWGTNAEKAQAKRKLRKVLAEVVA